MKYPFTRRVDVVDDYHGTKVPDPYRWLEETDSPEVQAWADSQNALTDEWMASRSDLEKIRQRMEQYLSYERRTVPVKSGKYHYDNQRPAGGTAYKLYRTETIDSQGVLVFDPESLGQGKLVYMYQYNSFSPDGKYLCYGTVESGGDWLTYRIKDLETLRDLDETIVGSTVHCPNFKWQGSKGFYYWRYTGTDQHTGKSNYTGAKVFWHSMGTAQAEDDLIYECPDKPEIRPFVYLQTDERYLAILLWDNSDPENNRFLYRPMDSDVRFKELYPGKNFDFLGNIGPIFFFRTSEGAPLGKVIAIDVDKKGDNISTVIPELGGDLAAQLLKEGMLLIAVDKELRQARYLYDLEGKKLAEIPLPGMGRVDEVSEIIENKIYFSFSSYLDPYTIYTYYVNEQTMEVFWRPDIGFDFKGYGTELIFYPSKDGTKIPLYLTHSKEVKRDGSQPVLLEGYGYAGATNTPHFKPDMLPWLEKGGIHAWAGIRGGGEYGEEWHRAGKSDNKQNTFDDFAAAAEFLVAEGYTRHDKIAISGSSWGGCLVAVAMEQHSEYYGAVVCRIPLTDMLRQHKSGVGHLWIHEFGDPEKTPKEFNNLISYSPLNNVKAGARYPPILISCGDTDQRVPPHHAYKFTAALQAANPDNIVLLRVEKNAGHCVGGVADKRRCQALAEEYAFILDSLEYRESRT